VVQRAFGGHKPVRVDFRDPIHERRAKAMHGVSTGHLLAQKHLHRIIGLTAGTASPAASEYEPPRCHVVRLDRRQQGHRCRG
jgi:hypothetical protein